MKISAIKESCLVLLAFSDTFIITSGLFWKGTSTYEDPRSPRASKLSSTPSTMKKGMALFTFFRTSTTTSRPSGKGTPKYKHFIQHGDLYGSAGLFIIITTTLSCLTSTPKCACIITYYHIRLLPEEASPWYNHTGWLGVKHQLTYLLTPEEAVQSIVWTWLAIWLSLQESPHKTKTKVWNTFKNVAQA